MRQTFVVLKEQSTTRAAQLAARGRGGYVPRARGRGYQGRGGGWRGGRGGVGGGNYYNMGLCLYMRYIFAIVNSNTSILTMHTSYYSV